MRKILPLVLVISMIFSLPVVSFAENGSGGTTVGTSATLDGHTPDEEVDWGKCSTNDGSQSFNFRVSSNKRPTRISYGTFEVIDKEGGFDEGFFEKFEIEQIIEQDDGTFLSDCKVYNPSYTAQDIGTHIGAVKVHFEDDSLVEFAVKLIISNAPSFKLVVVDESSNIVDLKNLSRGIYTFKLQLVDPERLFEKSKISKLNAKWKIDNGHNRIRIDDKIPDNQYIPDKNTVQIANIYEQDFLFGLTFEAKNPGEFRFLFEIFDDDNQEPYCGQFNRATIIGELNIISEEDLEEVFTDNNAEKYTIELDKGNTGLDKSSFEAIWGKANGKPVDIMVEGGVSITFDTSKDIGNGFLDDLKENNDGVFNPSVNLNIPDEANNSGFSGGKWIEFMHSGKLPGTVTIKLPISSYSSGKAIKLWYYDSVTGRATMEPTEVSRKTIDGVEYAVFTITHCSAYALYPEGQNPNPVKNTSDKPNDKSNSGSNSRDKDNSTSSYTDWSSLREKVREAKSGDTILFVLSKGERLSASVLRALAKMDNVTLKVRYNGESINILSDDVSDIQIKDYSFKELLAIFGDNKTTKKDQDNISTSDKSELGSKPNPGTGAYPDN